MDDWAVITDDFFLIPLLDGSEYYGYDEQEMKESMEKARLAKEYCRRFEKRSQKIISKELVLQILTARRSLSKKIRKKCCPCLDTYLSGSPFTQNGHIIGAVTHVFISDSTQGYGIFIENMLEH